MGFWYCGDCLPGAQHDTFSCTASKTRLCLALRDLSMAPAHIKPDADPDATAAARKRKSKEDGVNAALARGKLRRLEEEEGNFTKSSLLVLDGSCDLTIKDIMNSEDITFAEAVEVALRFRAEAAQAAADHPKAGGSLPSASPSPPKSRAPNSPVPNAPKSPDVKSPAPKSILKKKAKEEAAEGEPRKADASVTFKSNPKDSEAVQEEESKSSQVSQNGAKVTCKSSVSEKGLGREEVRDAGSAKKKKQAGGKAKEEDNAEPVEPPLVSKASKEKKCKVAAVHGLGEASSSSGKRKRKEDMYDELAHFGDFIDEDISQAKTLCHNLTKLKAKENLEEEQDMEQRHAAWIEWWETWGQYEGDCGEDDWEDWEDWGNAEWEGGDGWWGEQVEAEARDLIPRRLRFKQPETKAEASMEEWPHDRQPDPLLAYGWLLDVIWGVLD